MLSMDPAQGLAALAKLASGEQTQATYLGAFQAWAGASLDGGAAAAASAAALPPSSEQIAALQGAASGWAHNDPQAALDWASTLPSADAAVQQAAVTVAGESYPDLATPYLDKLTNASARNQAIQAISQAWAVGKGSDPAGALAWLDQVATGDTYDKSVSNIISRLVQKQPAAAASLTEKVTEPGLNLKLVTTVAVTWGRKDPQATLAWLQTLPESTPRDTAIQKLTQEVGDNTP
jgi:hypothetical protein